MALREHSAGGGAIRGETYVAPQRTDVKYSG
jgi:hypothetical protein